MLRMSFNRDDCEYTKFNIENSTIEFVAAENGVLISVPFADDTPQCIKDRLKEGDYFYFISICDNWRN